MEVTCPPRECFENNITPLFPGLNVRFISVPNADVVSNNKLISFQFRAIRIRSSAKSKPGILKCFLSFTFQKSPFLRTSKPGFVLSSHVSRFEINSANKRGLKGHPCFRPCSNPIHSDVLLPQDICTPLFVYNPCSMLTQLSGIFRNLSTSQSL